MAGLSTFSPHCHGRWSSPLPDWNQPQDQIHLLSRQCRGFLLLTYLKPSHRSRDELNKKPSHPSSSQSPGLTLTLHRTVRADVEGKHGPAPARHCQMLEKPGSSPLTSLCFTRPKEAGTPCNPSTGEAQVGLLGVSDQPGLTQTRAT